MGVLGIHRTRGGITNDNAPGLRLLLPVWAKRDRCYDVNLDEFRTGVWFFAVGLTVNTLGLVSFNAKGQRGTCHGLSARITWGWLPSQFAVVTTHVRPWSSGVHA